MKTVLELRQFAFERQDWRCMSTGRPCALRKAGTSPETIQMRVSRMLVAGSDANRPSSGRMW